MVKNRNVLLKVLANHIHLNDKKVFLSLSSSISILMSILILLSNIHVAHALSATTANTIQGTKPYLVLSDGTPNGTKLTTVDELLSFSMWDGRYTSSSIKDLTSRTQITAPLSGTKTLPAPIGMTFADVTPLVTPNGGAAQSVVGLTMGDADGDAILPANTSAQGKMVAVWKDDGIVVTDLTKTLTSCGGPYTLELSIPNTDPVIATTTYGAPNTNNYGFHTGVTYTFTSTSRGVCNLEPKNMTEYTTTGLAGVNSLYPTTGYNPAKWDAGKGFKPDSGFPTTSFDKAVFTLVMSGNQSDYDFSSDNSVASIDPSTGVVTLLYSVGMPSPTFTVTLTATTNTGPIESFPYTFIITKWVRVLGKYQYTNNSTLASATAFPAASMCKDGSTTSVTTQTDAATYFFKPSEFSNAPSVVNAVTGHGTEQHRLLILQNDFREI